MVRIQLEHVGIAFHLMYYILTVALMYIPCLYWFVWACGSVALAIYMYEITKIHAQANVYRMDVP